MNINFIRRRRNDTNTMVEKFKDVNISKSFEENNYAEMLRDIQYFAYSSHLIADISDDIGRQICDYLLTRVAVTRGTDLVYCDVADFPTDLKVEFTHSTKRIDKNKYVEFYEYRVSRISEKNN